MADRRTKKTAKQIFGYARLNFHMGMRQGKNLAVLLCMGCFFALLSRWHSWVSGIGRRNGQCAGVIPGYDEYTLYGNDSLGWLSACDL